MRPYEMMVLYHPDLEIDIDKALKKVEKIITSNKGKVIKVDSWGKRKLAYSIQKQDHAIYVYYDIEIPPESFTKIESALNITSEVIRYLMVTPGPDLEDDSSEKNETGKTKDTTSSSSDEETEEK